LTCWFAASASADPDGAAPDKKDRPKRPPAVTAEQEADVMEFLRQHHAELSGLLVHLKSTRPSEFQRAVRELWYAQERLKQIKQRDGERYELEVKAWVLESKIQLVVARLAMNDCEALRTELRQLLGERADLKLRILVSERDAQAQRLKKLDEQIDQLSAGRSELIERQFAAMTKSSENLKAKGKKMKPSPKKADRPSTASKVQGPVSPSKVAPR
jgi:hypothetical protein